MVEKIMKVANDLGYGSVKANVDGENIKFPSVIAAERPQDVQAPMEFDSKQDQDTYMKNFLNNMDVSVSSNAVKTSGTAFPNGTGTRAWKISGQSIRRKRLWAGLPLPMVSNLNRPPAPRKA